MSSSAAILNWLFYNSLHNNFDSVRSCFALSENYLIFPILINIYIYIYIIDEYLINISSL